MAPPARKPRPRPPPAAALPLLLLVAAAAVITTAAARQGPTEAAEPPRARPLFKISTDAPAAAAQAASVTPKAVPAGEPPWQAGGQQGGARGALSLASPPRERRARWRVAREQRRARSRACVRDGPRVPSRQAGAWVPPVRASTDCTVAASRTPLSAHSTSRKCTVKGSGICSFAPLAPRPTRGALAPPAAHAPRAPAPCRIARLRRARPRRVPRLL